MWNLTFYSIFTFKFNANNHLTNITDKMNPVGKTLIGIASLWFLYLIFPDNPTEFNPIDNWQWITIIAVFVFFSSLGFSKDLQNGKEKINLRKYTRFWILKLRKKHLKMNGH